MTTHSNWRAAISPMESPHHAPSHGSHGAAGAYVSYGHNATDSRMSTEPLSFHQGTTQHEAYSGQRPSAAPSHGTYGTDRKVT